MSANKEKSKDSSNYNHSDAFKWNPPTKGEIVERSVQQLRTKLREINPKGAKLTKKA